MGDIVKNLESARKLWRWFVKLPPYLWPPVIVFSLALAFVLARTGSLGAEFRDLAFRLVPVEIPFIDPPVAAIELSLVGEVQTSPHDRERVVLGGSYPADSEMTLAFGCGTPCWLMVIGIDMQQIYGVFPHPGKPPEDAAYITPEGGSTELPFRLDGTQGEELFVAIASSRPFNYQRHVEASLDNMLQRVGVRGANFQYVLDLDDRFARKTLYFQAY